MENKRTVDDVCAELHGLGNALTMISECTNRWREDIISNAIWSIGEGIKRLTDEIDALNIKAN